MSIQQIAKQLEVLTTQKERIRLVSAIPSDISSELINVELNDFAEKINSSAFTLLLPQYDTEIERLNKLAGFNND